jgi:hypothetical protein
MGAEIMAPRLPNEEVVEWRIVSCCSLRRWRRIRNATAMAMAMIPTIPPTTPPTIAGVLVLSDVVVSGMSDAGAAVDVTPLSPLELVADAVGAAVESGVDDGAFVPDGEAEETAPLVDPSGFRLWS